MTSSKQKVLVCVLTSTERQGWPCPELSSMCTHMSHDPRFEVAITHIKDARPVEVARNTGIKLARDNGFDWCVQLDNDNYMPEGTPLDVIAQATSKQDIVGLRYGIIANQYDYRLFPPATGGLVEGPFEEVPAVAGGVLMICRRVWEVMPRGPWFRWTFAKDSETGEGEGGAGEDCSFCKLCASRGLRVWTHRQHFAAHYRSVDLTHVSTMQTSFAPSQLMTAADSLNPHSMR